MTWLKNAMRIIVDTNILVSVALYPDSLTEFALIAAMQKHTLVMCTYAIDEAHDVFRRKFPYKMSQLDQLLAKLSYELCYTPQVNPNTPAMRDENDRPILQAAIEAEADAILTGDKDFHALTIDRPAILSPAMLLSLDA